MAEVLVDITQEMHEEFNSMGEGNPEEDVEITEPVSDIEEEGGSE